MASEKSVLADIDLKLLAFNCLRDKMKSRDQRAFGRKVKKLELWISELEEFREQIFIGGWME